MSKGSLFFGRATGKLGQIVLSNVKGQQIARAWQPKVANPRTSVQQIQRAKFANSVKFYKRATQNLFKFAFEDKRKTESDYNAFMRHNVESAMVVNRASYDNLYYPALANDWIIAAGSLGNLRAADYDSRTVSNACCLLYPNVAEGSGYKFPEGITEQTVTIGQISEWFKQMYGAAEGDFVTFVGITSTVKKIDDSPSFGPMWSITQIKIDSTSPDLFLQTVNKQAANNLGFEFVERVGTLIWKTTGSTTELFGVVLSRVTSNGVLVSTSNLAANLTGYGVYRASLENAYRQLALTSWNRSTDPILKGSVVKQSNV